MGERRVALLERRSSGPGVQTMAVDARAIVVHARAMAVGATAKFGWATYATPLFVGPVTVPMRIA